jgi:hypothetical protein
MKESTLITALRIAQAVEANPEIPTQQPDQELRKVIVRGDRSGVFYGDIVSRDGREVTLANARHVWYWNGAANTAEMANLGVSKPNDCKIVAPVNRILILDAIEVLDCTDVAVASLDAVPAWSKR